MCRYVEKSIYQKTIPARQKGGLAGSLSASREFVYEGIKICSGVTGEHWGEFSRESVYLKEKSL
jgi:hypothetical protein